MKILVAGGEGLVGRLVQQQAEQEHDVHALGRAELDITSAATCRSVLKELRPDVVINCAAFTDVDGAESDPASAYAVNAEGAGHLASAAEAQAARLFHVSTDYVFDGRARAPYRESEPPAPLSVYGKSKWEGEKQVAQNHPEGHAIVRTAWIYGPGKGFVDWAAAKLERGEEVPLITDQVGSPTNAALLASALLRLAEDAHRGLFHYVNRGATTWLALGRFLAEAIGIDRPAVREILADDLGRPAPRPSYSVLDVSRFEKETGTRVPSWEEGVRSHLRDRNET